MIQEGVRVYRIQHHTRAGPTRRSGSFDRTEVARRRRHVNDQHVRMADQIVAQFAEDINTEQLQEAIIGRLRNFGTLQRDETAARCQELLEFSRSGF